MGGAPHPDVTAERRGLLNAIRSRPQLRRAARTPAVEAPLLQSLSDAELAFAAGNPSYAPDVRAAARLGLSARLGGPEALRAIDGFVAALPPPPWLRPDDVEADDRVFFGAERWARLGLGGLALLSLLPWLALATALDGPWPPQALWAPMVAVPAWLAAVALRRKPARVLALNGAEALARSLSAYGQVFAFVEPGARRDLGGALLSADLYHPLLLLWRLVALAAWPLRLLDRSRFGPIVVVRARDYRSLARRLSERIGLNLTALRALGQVIRVRADAAWRRHVLTLLALAADVIVVDVGDRSDFPLDDRLRRRVGERLVFVAAEERAEVARAALSAAGFAEAAVTFYRRRGPAEPEVFRSRMLAALRRRHGV